MALSRVSLSLVSSAISVSLALAFTPLVDKRFQYSQLPYKVDTDVGLIRGDQLGYNICNATTEGPTSLCQTAIINSLDDFCIWAPPTPGRTVGEIEGEMVAWCTKGGHGTRVMPSGTITGVQLTRTPDYIQVVGFMNQTLIDMVHGDEGGEMDPHGADRRGNPMGGVVYTQAFADNGSYTQVIEWHNFNGGNTFCFKACDPSRPNGPKLCQHIFDTQGCGFNAPSNARNGVFESCAGDSQAPPGQGVAVPKSSSCSTFASTDIYGGGVTVRVPGATFVPTTTAPATTGISLSAGTGASGSTGSGAIPSQTQTSDAWKPTAVGGTVGSLVVAIIALLL